VATAEVAASAKHCLWRVTNARAPFYLLGSVHALQRSDYEKALAVEEAIKQSQLTLFEVDPKEDQTFAQKLGAAARLPKRRADSGEDKSQDIQLSAEDNHQWNGGMAASLSLGDRNAFGLSDTPRC
jgi:uncharacterized protein YbaP (TraB family)